MVAQRLTLVLALTFCVAAPCAGKVGIDIGSAGADGAGNVTVEVRLRSDGEAVGAFQNDILFNHEVLELDPRDCVIGRDIGELPFGPPPAVTCFDDASIGPCKTLSKDVTRCSEITGGYPCPSTAGPEVSRFRAIVAATATLNDNQIPDGSLLYSCTFRVLDPSGLPQRLVNWHIVSSDPVGERHADAGGIDGSVCSDGSCAVRVALAEPCSSSVECLPDECDATSGRCVAGPTPTPLERSTADANVSSGGDDGCQISATPATANGLWLMVAAGFLALRRRRLRPRP